MLPWQKRQESPQGVILILIGRRNQGSLGASSRSTNTILPDGRARFYQTHVYRLERVAASMSFQSHIGDEPTLDARAKEPFPKPQRILHWEVTLAIELAKLKPPAARWIVVEFW